MEAAIIIIEGFVRLPPENVETARGAMLSMVQASRAEPGCLDYTYAMDIEDPGLVRVIERWETRAALAAHFQRAHMAAWRAAWPALGITDRRLRLYEADPEPI